MKRDQKKIAVLKNGIGYIGPLIGIPFTLKFIDPASYGIYAVFVAVVTLITPLLTIRAEMVAPAAKDAGVCEEFFKLSGVALTVTTGLLVFASSVGVLGGYLTLSFALALFAASYFQGWSNIHQAIAIYQGNPGAIIDARLAQGIVYGLFQPLFVYLGGSIEALLLSDVLARLFFAVVLFIENKKGRCPAMPRLRVTRINWNVVRIKDLFLSNLSVLFNGLSVQFIVIFSGIFFGAQASAAVGVAYKILSAPVRIVSQALQPYFLSEFSASYRSGAAVRGILYKYLKIGFLISLPVYGVVVLLASLLVESYLIEWIFALDYLYVIWPAFLISFFVIPISQALVVTQNSQAQMKWEVLRLLLLCVVSFICVVFLEASALQAVLSLVVSMGLAYISLIYIVIKVFKV
ncbi:oligosaccharide flippase family protein [Thauera terpenica]|uniref:oligosaccharide flippase family protein n=1 Tax=Thauera terpenica TaxID=76113 RepID=UPI0012FBEBE7|nr:oligosaccharide flippase family protein [Thauera terpenica]